jgi:hypothetical protein
MKTRRKQNLIAAALVGAPVRVQQTEQINRQQENEN